MSGAQSWMLYGAAGHTGALIAQHAQQRTDARRVGVSLACRVALGSPCVPRASRVARRRRRWHAREQCAQGAHAARCLGIASGGDT